MQLLPEEYGQMRAWLGSVTREILPANLQSPQTDPVAVLDQIAATAPAKAREGLSMAISDLVELTSDWSRERVEAMDRRLLADGLPTLTAVRASFSKVVQRAIRRGRIKDDVEYHAVRNAAELAATRREQLWQLLAAYEDRAAG